MNLKTKLAAAALMIGSVSIAQATTYEVNANFSDGGVQGETLFNGSFDWDGTSVTNFTGLLSEAMWGYDSAGDMGAGFYMNGTAGGMHEMANGGAVYAKPGGYMDNEAPLLELTNQLASSTAGGLVTTSIFLENSTDVFSGGGYASGGVMTDGSLNAFFTLVFDAANPLNTTLAITNEMAYGDCTGLGLMSGIMCMTGHESLGTMNGAPSSLSISEVSAVPVPAAAWLFGGALISLFGANRRKSVLPA